MQHFSTMINRLSFSLIRTIVWCIHSEGFKRFMPLAKNVLSKQRTRCTHFRSFYRQNPNLTKNSNCVLQKFRVKWHHPGPDQCLIKTASFKFPLDGICRKIE